VLTKGQFVDGQLLLVSATLHLSNLTFHIVATPVAAAESYRIVVNTPLPPSPPWPLRAVSFLCKNAVAMLLHSHLSFKGLAVQIKCGCKGGARCVGTRAAPVAALAARSRL
jgi:hypothetical protein